MISSFCFLFNFQTNHGRVQLQNGEIFKGQNSALFTALLSSDILLAHLFEAEPLILQNAVKFNLISLTQSDHPSAILVNIACRNHLQLLNNFALLEKHDLTLLVKVAQLSRQRLFKRVSVCEHEAR